MNLVTPENVPTQNTSVLLVLFAAKITQTMPSLYEAVRAELADRDEIA